MGELTPENRHHRDYAKWKAAYIHNCLKNGETPVAGPVDGAPEKEDGDLEDQAVGGGQPGGWDQGQAFGGLPGVPGSFDQPAASGWGQPVPAPRRPAQQTYPEAQQPGTVSPKYFDV